MNRDPKGVSGPDRWCRLVLGLVLLLCGWSRPAAGFEYAGSEACGACHQEIFTAWQKTPHFRMTRTPASLPYFKDIPVEGFEGWRDQVKLVLGSHYVHRFVAEASGTLVVLPGIFDLNERKWLTTRDYGWQKRFYLKQCGGCHTTGFTAPQDSYVEIGVGCESCHGPGLNHVRTQAPEFIVHPGKLSSDRREMICESCHTSGVDPSGNYCFPVGYRPGEDLTQFYFGLTPKPGQDPESFFGDETYQDRRRQWEFLQNRLFLAKGLTCDYCQNFRNYQTSNNSEYLTHSEYCGTCHQGGAAPMPATGTASAKPSPCPRTGASSSPSPECVSCHAPARVKDGSRYAIHDHKFSFQKPIIASAAKDNP